MACPPFKLVRSTFAFDRKTPWQWTNCYFNILVRLIRLELTSIAALFTIVSMSSFENSPFFRRAASFSIRVLSRRISLAFDIVIVSWREQHGRELAASVQTMTNLSAFPPPPSGHMTRHTNTLYSRTN